MKQKNSSAGFRSLSTLLHLRTAVIEQRPVLVFMAGELIGSGVIDAIDENVTFDDITEDIVYIKGERYIRNVCAFYYAR
ncbi:hypothetical protein [Paenibacillus xanthanilyticus]|uniref:Uncharacterized protein n=1 Tax=Paenibacillus xanthanilyticus TaxID=1783531 RepID=A0ABV8KC74_9BACL